VTQTASIYSNLIQSPELVSFDLQERKAWIKPEIREIDFSATAAGGNRTNDGFSPS
jgi:hypothetical protein